MSNKDLDNFISKLQEKIKEKEKEEYNEYIIDLLHNPKNFGKLTDKETTVSQTFTGPCGDTMQFFLKINDNIIEKARFTTDGCVASFATASQTTLFIEGNTIDFAEKLTAEDIDKALHGLPEDHKHCAELAIRTLKRAIQKYKDK